MAHSPCLNHIDVIVLAGGLGTRIRDTLGDTPKLLARVNDRPFLDFLIGRLKGFGAGRLFLGLGTLGGGGGGDRDAHPPERPHSRAPHFREDFDAKADPLAKVNTVISKHADGTMRIRREEKPKLSSELAQIIEEMQ